MSSRTPCDNMACQLPTSELLPPTYQLCGLQSSAEEQSAELLRSVLQEIPSGEARKVEKSLSAKFQDCRDGYLSRIWQIKTWAYQLQGAGYKCARTACGPGQRTTVKFDVFDDDVLKKGFYEEDNRPNEYQEAIHKSSDTERTLRQGSCGKCGAPVSYGATPPARSGDRNGIAGTVQQSCSHAGT